MSRAVAVVALLLAIALSGCDPLSAAELRRQVGTVEAISSEGGLLADQAGDDRTTVNFVRVHAGDLGEEMDHTAEKLEETEAEDEVPDELAEPVDRTIKLASDAADALQDLEFDPGNKERARGSAEQLRETMAEAKALSETL